MPFFALRRFFVAFRWAFLRVQKEQVMGQLWKELLEVSFVVNRFLIVLIPEQLGQDSILKFIIVHHYYYLQMESRVLVGYSVISVAPIGY